MGACPEAERRETPRKEERLESVGKKVESPLNAPRAPVVSRVPVLKASARVPVPKAPKVPIGFAIVPEPPEEALIFVGKPASAASEALSGRRIMRKWEGL